MPTWTSAELAVSALTTLQDVLVHQRARWAALFGHQHQYEGWWKAEFYLALESWCWRTDLPEPTWVRSEVKPRDHGIGGTKQSIDLLVARWDDTTGDIRPDPPRVWVEIKERGTWWGDPGKALREEGRGLAADIAKWRDAEWQDGDIVVACQIVAHDAPADSYDPIPTNWKAVLDDIATTAPRFLPTRSVGCRAFSPDAGEPINRYATIDFFTVRGSEHIPARACSS